MEFRSVKLDDGTYFGVYVDSELTDVEVKRMINARSRQLAKAKPVPQVDPDYVGFTDKDGNPIA